MHAVLQKLLHHILEAGISETPLASPNALFELLPANCLWVCLSVRLVGIGVRPSQFALRQLLFGDLGDTVHRKVAPAKPFSELLTAKLLMSGIVAPYLPQALLAILPSFLDSAVILLRHLNLKLN